jgi:hypothetical protein
MAEGRKPDYRVLLPVARGENQKPIWHRMGVAWKRDNGSIGIVLDVGTTLIFRPRTELVLMPNDDAHRDAAPAPDDDIPF